METIWKTLLVYSKTCSWKPDFESSFLLNPGERSLSLKEMNVSEVFSLDRENTAPNQPHLVRLNPAIPHTHLIPFVFHRVLTPPGTDCPAPPHSWLSDLREHTGAISSVGGASDNMKLFTLELWPDFVKSHMVRRQTEEQSAQPRSARSDSPKLRLMRKEEIKGVLAQSPAEHRNARRQKQLSLQ